MTYGLRLMNQNGMLVPLTEVVDIIETAAAEFDVPQRDIDAEEIVDRLAAAGGTSGHAEMLKGYDYDSVCTAIDTELYKLVTMEMLTEAGVSCLLNTFTAGAIVEGGRVQAAITESRETSRSW